MVSRTFGLRRCFSTDNGSAWWWYRSSTEEAGAPGTMLCFDPDQTKCITCGREKVVLRLGGKQ